MPVSNGASPLALAALALTLACGGAPRPTGPAAAPGPARANSPKPAQTPASPPPAATPATTLATPATLAGERVAGPLALTHGGVGSPPSLSEGTDAAARAALARLTVGDDALAAAIAGTVVLEDDPRFNAGTGSNIRLDGATIQMDAALMTDDGRFAAVAVIERVRNPIRAARLVLDSPHLLLAGEGATRFAHAMGLPDEVPRAAEAERKYQARLAELEAAAGRGEPAALAWRRYWNFPGEMPAAMKAWREGGDTVGTVTRDADGRFAATLSTGGTSVTLHGRVGDVPIYGAGLYAGEHGAVACTGEGEWIIRHALARATYEEIAAGASARDAVHAAVAGFPADIAVGVIAVDRGGWGVAANLEMAHGVAHSPPR